MNTSQSTQMVIDSQLLQQIVRLKVQLQKCKSQVQGYKQMQQGYKKINMKSQLLEKQLVQYQQIMALFFDRVKKFMILLQIDSTIKGQCMGKYHSFNDSNNSDNMNNNNNESISFINLKTDHNPAFSRRVNKLNSLKTIAQSYISNNNIMDNINNLSFYQQDNNFSLIQNRVKGLMKQNAQYRRTLNQYEKSCMNISLNIKQQQVIVKRLQSQIRMKEKQLQQTQSHIGQLLKKIQEMKDQLKTKQDTIASYQQQQQHLIKTYQQLSSKIQQLKEQNGVQQQRKNITRNKCHQLIGQLETTDDNYLLNYLMKDPIVIKTVTQQSTMRSFNNFTSNPYQNNLQNNQYFSQSGGKNHNTKYHPLSLSHKNKHQFVFD